MTTQVAFLFPGQGSQAVGMGADVFEASAAARRVFEAVDEALGFSLSTLCFQGPEDTLRATINAQPAIVTVSLAFLAAFQEALSAHDSAWSSPLAPAYTAGHSVGEYTALVASGAMELKDAALLVRERGRLMEHEGTVCPSGMAAVIGMDAEVLQEVCQQASEQAQAELASAPGHPGLGKVVIANYNAPGQIVISGEKRALELASDLARTRGAKRVIPLSVSGAFHSPVMQPAADQMVQVLATANLHDATIPLISNITAAPLLHAESFRPELAQQVATSVQWVRSIEYLVAAGVTMFIEIGPGQALTGMIKRIARGTRTLNIGTVADLEKAVALVRELNIVL
ncbi:[acyl-carrier-protein] S-malonyltransferase [Ktedonosporobacter rubrisoli]|uniref:Malonyl CoA-acyl carrier protein transacylase n=1 Tax=Ktedonosporobacter rubrisoli TaxID=2509675 RepID=A0A4V0YZB8_KTERU|nr:ACP S-malonyltransferase [Ktedonosporobacter rubrisoli]QBD79171.1 [acyl-carrier-protein] S-malonyltransferase [Ktedonosporobacter rubrisoli]